MTFIQKNFFRILRLCLGLLMIGVGGSLFVYSNLGSDPFNLMSQGLARILHLHVGTTNSLVQLSILVILLFVQRRRIGLGTVFSVLLIGSVMNFWSALFAPFLSAAVLPVRLVCVVFAPICVGFGVALVQIADLGMVPNDILPLVIFEKLGRFEFRAVRITYDLMQLGIGVVLGGVFGVGTIVSALLTGPSIQWAWTVLRSKNATPIEPDT